MKRVAAVTVIGLLLSPVCRADDAASVSSEYARIVADYRAIEGATEDESARAAAERLTLRAYRRLIESANALGDLSAEDQYALGACHEALGDRAAALRLYTESLNQSESAAAHLGLVRVTASFDIATAEAHYANAARLEPNQPQLGGLRLLLAGARGQRREWSLAAAHLEQYHVFLQSLAQQRPDSAAAAVAVAAIEQQVDRLHRFDGMTRQPAPALPVAKMIQGDAPNLEALRGKVVVIDFCSVSSDESREQMARLGRIAANSQGPVEVFGFAEPTRLRYDAESDSLLLDQTLTIDDEAAALAAFAAQHQVGYALGLVSRAVIEEYGVTKVPHTVVIDPEGNVHAILLPNGQSDLEQIVAGLANGN